MPSPGAPESEIVDDIRNDLAQMEGWLAGIEATAVANENAASATGIAEGKEGNATDTEEPSVTDMGTGTLPSATDISAETMMVDSDNSTDTTALDAPDALDAADTAEPTARHVGRVEKRDSMLRQGEVQGQGLFLSAEQLEAEMLELMG